MQRKERAKERFRDAFFHTDETISTDPTIELLANRQMTIQGAKGIIEYSEELIRVSLINMEVRVYGEQMCIDCLSQDGLEIRGKILRVEYL